MSFLNNYKPLLAPMLNTYNRDLSTITASTATVFEALAGEYTFNMHPFVAEHNGNLFVIHSTNTGTVEDAVGQRVRVLSSSDGLSWSDLGFIAEDNQSYTYIPRGLWDRDGDLIAMCTIDNTVNDHLYAFKYNGTTWDNLGVQIEDVLSNEAPIKTEGGKWAFPTRKGNSIYLARGDIGNWTEELVSTTADLIEPSFMVGRNGVEQMVFRSGEFFLYRSVNQDGSWTTPEITNFLDAKAKVHRLYVSGNNYYMFSNMFTSSNSREILNASISYDGVSYDEFYVLRDNPTAIKFGGSSARLGYHYPNSSVFNGNIAVVYSLNKEDIQISLLPA